MAQIRFFAKPGCAGNARQQRLLLEAGHQLEVIDLLSYPWSAETLGAFLADVPVADWFNRAAPPVKSGQLLPEQLDAGRALALLLADPRLIRRPLLEIGGRRYVGFDAARLGALLPAHGGGNLEACPHPQKPCTP